MKFDPALHRPKSRPQAVCTYSRSVEIARPPDVVLDFCLQAENFAAILPFQIAPAPDTDEMVGYEGHVYPFIVRFAGLKFRWVALIEELVPGDRFSDSMLEGPLRYWHHRHECRPTPTGCVYSDVLAFRTRAAPLAVDRALSRRLVDRIFRYRQTRMKALLEADPP